MKHFKGLYILLLFLLTQAKINYAQNILINLFNDYSVKSATVNIISGKYNVIGDSNTVSTLSKGSIIYIAHFGDKILLHDELTNYGLFSTLEIKNLDDKGAFVIKPVSPQIASRVYEGSLTSKVDFNRLLLVNDVLFESYLAGVVETETGPNSVPEFYKSQALLCRTYALKNFDRHYAEGFNLCDGTHCQAYKSKCRLNQEIIQAVWKTQELVIIGPDSALITAAFHANSGGETYNSEDVWLARLPYLRSIQDPFSLKGKQAEWEKAIPKNQWISYLKKNGMTNNSASIDLNYIQNSRKRNYIIGDFSIPLAKIRHDWQLKSTFFDVEDNDDNIVLRGRGYGHGVGLSQEGAMIMASSGYLFEDIIHFYFQNVDIVSAKKLKTKLPW